MEFSVSRRAPWRLLFRIYNSLDGFASLLLLDPSKDNSVNPAQRLLCFFGEFIPRWPIVSAKLLLLLFRIPPIPTHLRLLRTYVGLYSRFPADTAVGILLVHYRHLPKNFPFSPLYIFQHRLSVPGPSGLPRRPALTSSSLAPQLSDSVLPFRPSHIRLL